MTVDIMVAEGAFSKLTITLNSDMTNKLAVINTEYNPLARVDKKLKKVLADFEKAYFKAASKLEATIP